MNDYIVVIVSASNVEEAEGIAMQLVSAGVAPCINIVTHCRSVYQWKGEFRKDDEVLMFIKSRKKEFGDLVKIVERHHSYDVPEIIGMEVAGMSDKYRGYFEDFFRQIT